MSIKNMSVSVSFLATFYLVVPVCADNPLSKPIRTICPNDNDGVLEQIRLASDGYKLRVRYFYQSYKVAQIVVEEGPAGEPFKPTKNLKFGQIDDTEKDFWNKSVDTIKPIYEKVCNGTSDYRKRYMDMIDANHREMGILNGQAN